MAKQKEVKTNAMRILETLKIPYTHITYECDEFVDALQIADMLSLPYEKVYKTLVTVGSSREYYVFVIPIARELDLKAAARSVGQKSVEMLHVKDINKVTGYIRGGCTAIGMKKQYVTRIDSSAQQLEKIIVSGGRIGSQLELSPEDLARAAGAEFAEISCFTEGRNKTSGMRAAERIRQIDERGSVTAASAQNMKSIRYFVPRPSSFRSHFSPQQCHECNPPVLSCSLKQPAAWGPVKIS